MRILRTIIISIILTICTTEVIKAQQIVIDTVTIDAPIKKKELLIGVKYGFAITNLYSTPYLDPKSHNSPLNLSLLVTYFTPLWGYMDYFGIQTGVRYTNYGYSINKEGYEYLGQNLTNIEVPLISTFKYDIKKHFRVMLNLGPFAGYRLKTSKPGGFDCFDRRWDYGLEGGGGFAIRFNPVEIHIDCMYQYHFSWLYHPEIISSDVWLYTYPNNLSFNIGLHFKIK